jgi:RecA-family ATPase
MITLPPWPQELEAAPAQKVLRREVDKVLWAPKGTRNDTLNKAAFILGREIAGGLLMENDIVPALRDAAKQIGLPDGEAIATIKSGLEKGYERGSFEDRVVLQRASQFWDGDSLDRGAPEREWLLPHLVPMNNVTLLNGDGGTGKSLLALQLAVAVATGGMWLNRYVRHGGTVYFGAEDEKDEMHRRLDDITAGMGIEYKDLSHFSARSLAGEDALLAREELGGPLQRSKLYTEVEDHIKLKRPALVVIDTLADVYPANENDRAKVRQFVGMLRHLAIAYECAVVMLAHPSLTGIASGTGTSGSTGWNNSVRSRLYLRRIADKDGTEADVNARVLTSMKANYGPTGSEIRMAWHEGLFVVTEQGPQAPGQATVKGERAFLACLDDHISKGLTVNPTSGSNYAPTVFADQQYASLNEGVSKSGFKFAMRSLQFQKKITVVQVGKAKAIQRVQK